MPLWKNNDREDSKPTWLTAGQKRFCVRTNAGWELPVAAGISNLNGQFEGIKNLAGATSFVPQMELLVAIPADPSATGVAASNFANRSVATNAGGTASSETAYAPYITTPFQGDSSTAGGPNSTGLSFDSDVNYGIDAYGVSTLSWNLYSGTTGYIKVKANDANFTNGLVLSMTGNMTGQATGGTKTMLFFTGASLTAGSAAGNIPVDVYVAMFGPTSAYQSDVGVLMLPKGLTPGTYGLTASVYDGTTGGGTATSAFKIIVR